MCIYERIIFKRTHYFLFYHLVGIVAFFIEELLLYVFGETSFLLIRIIVIYCGFTFFPIIAIYVSHQLRNTLQATGTFLSPPNIAIEYKTWVTKKIDDYFSFKSWPMRIAVFLIGTAVFATIWLLPRPNLSTFSIIIIYLSVLPGAYIGSHGCYFVIVILIFLSQFVKYPMQVPFFRIQSKEIKQIQSFFFNTSLIALLIYSYVLLIAWQSPFGFSRPVLFWLAIIGFFPLAMFLWSFYQIHNLLYRVKETYLNSCNDKIQFTVKKIDKKLTTDMVDALLKLMDVQTRIEKLPEWPINLGSTATLIITFILPTLNLALDFYRNR